MMKFWDKKKPNFFAYLLMPISNLVSLYNLLKKDQNLKFVAGKTMTDNFSNHIEIISTTDINMITSTPKTYKLNLDGLIDFDFMNFDNNFAFIDREYAIHKNIRFKSNNKYLFINDELNKNILSLIKNINSDIKIN